MPQSEEHRPLLPYLLLSGMEHAADVARFTPEMIRDAGVACTAACSRLLLMQAVARAALQAVLCARLRTVGQQRS